MDEIPSKHPKMCDGPGHLTDFSPHWRIWCMQARSRADDGYRHCCFEPASTGSESGLWKSGRPLGVDNLRFCTGRLVVKTSDPLIARPNHVFESVRHTAAPIQEGMATVVFRVTNGITLGGQRIPHVTVGFNLDRIAFHQSDLQVDA
jgi:hypothetical protein